MAVTRRKDTKLTVNDVVEIKRLLMQGHLTQKQIAERFDIARTAISKIKTGQQWADVEIDENGNYIEEVKEILAENYKIEIVNDEEYKVEIVEDESTKYRKMFVEGYFKIRGGVNPHFEPMTSKSKRYIGALWNSYRWLFNDEWNDFISEIAICVTEKVMTFEPNESDFDWSMVSDESTKEHAILHNYLNKAIKNRIIDYANEINNSFLEQKDNVKAWNKVEMASIDTTTNNSDGDEFPFIEELGIEANLFHMHDDYFGSHFLDWFSIEKETILTNQQLKFLTVMKYFVRDNDDKYTIPYSQLSDDEKPYSQNAVTHNKRRIGERIEAEWDKVDKMSLRELKEEKEREFFKGFMELVEIEDARVSEQNELMSKWIFENIDNEFLDNVLDNLGSAEIVEIRDKKLSNKTLYRIIEMIEGRLRKIKGDR